MTTDNLAKIQLHEIECFSRGGNRLCYVHPSNRNRCLKVLRKDRTPAMRREEKSLLSRLRPLSTFDENKVEASRLLFLHQNYSIKITQHLPRSYGLKMTTSGLAHETELIRDADGQISESLEQYIWRKGVNTDAQKAIRIFFEDWQSNPPKTRDLIPHNFAIQFTKSGAKLVLIDGFGRNTFFSSLQASSGFSQKRFNARKADFELRLARIVERSQTGDRCFGRIDALNRKL